MTLPGLPTAWNCSTVLSVYQACRGSQNILEFANLILFSKIELSDEESSVSLSQQGTVLNIQEKSQGRKVFTPLYVKGALWLCRCL